VHEAEVLGALVAPAAVTLPQRQRLTEEEESTLGKFSAKFPEMCPP